MPKNLSSKRRGRLQRPNSGNFKNPSSKRRGRLQRPNSRNFKPAAFIFVVTISSILHLWTSQLSDGRSATTSSVMIESEDAVTAFSKLQLFVTAFPGGFEQDFRPVMIRSLQFFWPTEYFRLTLVLDDTVYQNNNLTERDQMNDTVRSFFNFDLRDHIDVVYNPRSDPEEFHGGYNIQQLIGFWADNFTDAAYIGIMDDDTIFSKAVQPEDLFDERGRPHVIVKYPTGPKFPKGWYNGTNWALGRSAYTNAMSYFPVILHRKHLPMIRQEILRVHPEFDTFDDFFKFLSREKDAYSQFCIMFEYLWMHHRNDYNWHFEADGNSGPYFPNGFPIGSDIASSYPQVTPGSPAENGVTAEMLLPFPRVAVHGSWIPGGRLAYRRLKKTADIMRRGYCFSQPLHLFNNSSNATSSSGLELMQRRCKTYDVTTGADIFVDGEWLFEIHERWSAYDREGSKQAHLERAQKNTEHNWSKTELDLLFGVEA